MGPPTPIADKARENAAFRDRKAKPPGDLTAPPLVEAERLRRIAERLHRRPILHLPTD